MSDEDSNSELYLTKYNSKSIGGDVKTVTRNVRLYKDEDFSQVVEIAVGPLGQSREGAEGTIRWASNSDSAKFSLQKLMGRLWFLDVGVAWNTVEQGS